MLLVTMLSLEVHVHVQCIISTVTSKYMYIHVYVALTGVSRWALKGSTKSPFIISKSGLWGSACLHTTSFPEGGGSTLTFAILCFKCTLFKLLLASCRLNTSQHYNHSRKLVYYSNNCRTVYMYNVTIIIIIIIIIYMHCYKLIIINLWYWISDTRLVFSLQCMNNAKLYCSLIMQNGLKASK